MSRHNDRTEAKMRITERMLQARVDWLNGLTGNPLKPWAKNDDGKMKANIGNYHISNAYGGVSLHQMCTDGGGVRDVFSCGHIPKRELFERVCAFMEGIRCERESVKADEADPAECFDAGDFVGGGQ